MNSMYIDSLKHQILRSQRNMAEKGKIFGLSYGYKVKKSDDDEATGEREIDEEKADVIRNIFSMYADGHSLGSIIHILNARSIPSPKGKLWTKHTLMGNKSRHEGILRNQMYKGKIIWNLRSNRFNPDSGKRSLSCPQFQITLI